MIYIIILSFLSQPWWLLQCAV